MQASKSAHICINLVYSKRKTDLKARKNTERLFIINEIPWLTAFGFERVNSRKQRKSRWWQINKHCQISEGRLIRPTSNDDTVLECKVRGLQAVLFFPCYIVVSGSCSLPWLPRHHQLTDGWGCEGQWLQVFCGCGQNKIWLWFVIILSEWVPMHTKPKARIVVIGLKTTFI